MNDEETGPDNPNRYFERLIAKVPESSEIVRDYVRESIHSYLSECYLASSVMIGVASEAAFLELARSLGEAIPDAGARSTFIRNLDRPGVSISQRFRDFRNKLANWKGEQGFTAQFDAGTLDVELDGVFHLLKSYRNDAGHPRKRGVIDREVVFDHHRMLVRYLRLLYDLRQYFVERRAT